VRKVCAEIVDRFADRGHADMIADLGVPLPGAVIGPLTGLPAEYHQQFRRYSDDYMAAPIPIPRGRRGVAAVDEFDAATRSSSASGALERPSQRSAHRSRRVRRRRGQSLVRRQDPRASDQRHDRRRHRDHDASHRQPVLQPVQHAGAYERVRDDRSLVPIAVEETLRISGPVQILFRVPNADVCLADVEIPANSVVALGYASRIVTKKCSPIPIPSRSIAATI
jgi:cytochrome P450